MKGIMTHSKTIYVIHGPNLNLLGTREPEIYGKQTLEEVNAEIAAHAATKGYSVKTMQSNHEGVIIDFLHKIAQSPNAGVVLNPAAYTHYSIAIRDAIKATGLKVVEIHISDIEKREEFRKTSVIKDVCVAQVKGLGTDGYLHAVDLLLNS
jgi:3-dehydroquinate dehydratase-2